MNESIGSPGVGNTSTPILATQPHPDHDVAIVPPYAVADVPESDAESVTSDKDPDYVPPPAKQRKRRQRSLSGSAEGGDKERVAGK